MAQQQTQSAQAAPVTPAKPMKIGQLARKTGKTVRALHLYEEMGLLVPRRSQGGFRLYGADDLARVYWIGKLQDMGFKLAQISGLLEAVHSSHRAPDAMEGVRELFESKLADTRTQLSRLRQLEGDLKETLAYLEGCRTCSAEGDVSSCCGECGREQVRPGLISGIQQRGTSLTPNEEASK